jgi:hypothetical protein
VVKSAYQGLFPNTNLPGKEVDFQGSRQLDSFTRLYYEKELGAAVGPHPSGAEHFGYHTNQLQSSPELASLRADPKFQEALKAERAKLLLDTVREKR